MGIDTAEIRRESGASSVAWLAGAIGVTVGIATLAYGRRRRSRWDRANDFLERARKQAKPWMGIAAGGAAVGTALAAYARSRRQTGWESARRRAGEMVSQIGTQTPHWPSLAVSAAIALASAASARKARRRTIRGIDRRTAERINALAEKGAQLVQRVRDMSHETRKLYPRLRRLVA
jgi:ribosomal protein S16